MKNYARPRPTLPDSTPFLPGTKYSIVTPWHGKSTPSVDLTKEGSNYGGMESTGSLKRSATVGIMPNLSVNSKSLISSNKKKSPQHATNTELSLLADGGSSLTQSQEHSLGKFSKQVSNMSLTGRSVVVEEIHRKTQEANAIRETAEVIIDRTRAVEKKLESLKETEEVEMFQTARRKKIINSLSTINMMLINILEALELQPESDDGLTEIMLKYRAALLPEMDAAKRSPDGQAKGKLSKNDVYAINGKLRTMILTMSREYYRSSKQVKNAFTVYEGLRSELRAVEQRNRAVQHDVDEMRKEEMSNAASKMMSQQRAGFAALEVREGESEADKNLNFEDDLKEAVKRKSIDPGDGIILLQRLYSHMTSCPADLSIHTAANHVVAKAVLDILRVRLVTLFLAIPGRAGYMHKYTVKSANPEVVDVASSRSLVKEVMKLGVPVRINDIKTVPSDDSVDSIIAVPMQRVFSVPIRDIISGHLLGVLHIINKTDGDIFTGSDDMLLRIFAHQVGSLLSSCKVYDRTMSQNTLLTSLARASTDLASVIPEQGTPSGSQPLQVGEVLHALENVTKGALMCHKVRAFLVTGDFIGLPTGNLVFLEKSTFSGLTRHSSMLAVRLAPINSGIAGHVAQTMEWDQCVANAEPGDRHNSVVDLDPAGEAMITVPVRLPGAYKEHCYEGGVVAVLQMVMSKHSPKIVPTADDHDGISVLFAMLWLLNLISHPLLCLLSLLGGMPMQLTAYSFVDQIALENADSAGRSNKRSSFIAKQYRKWSAHTVGNGTLSSHMASTASTDMVGVMRRESSRMIALEDEEVDVIELDNMKRQITALMKANEKLRNPTTNDPKLLSAKAIMDGVQTNNKTFASRRKSEKFIKHQMHDCQRQLAVLNEKQKVTQRELDVIGAELTELREMNEDLLKDVETIVRDEEMLITRMNEKDEEINVIRNKIFEATSGAVERKLGELANAKDELESLRKTATELKAVNEEEESRFGERVVMMKKTLSQVSTKISTDAEHIKDPLFAYELGKVKLDMKEQRVMSLKQNVIESAEQSAAAMAAIRDYQLQLYALQADLLKIDALIDEKKTEIAMATVAQEHRITEAVHIAIEQAEKQLLAANEQKASDLATRKASMLTSGIRATAAATWNGIVAEVMSKIIEARKAEYERRMDEMLTSRSRKRGSVSSYSQSQPLTGRSQMSRHPTTSRRSEEHLAAMSTAAADSEGNRARGSTSGGSANSEGGEA